MKYLLIFFFFTSCQFNPVIDGKYPFIVGEITKYSDCMCQYGATRAQASDYGTAPGAAKTPYLFLPCNTYKIGDTIHVKDFKINK